MSINVGVIGLGYWGPNLVRNLNKVKNCKVIAVSDKNPMRLESIKCQYPFLNLYNDADEILSNPMIEAIVIATPVSTHYVLAEKALKHGKHVLIEKPMTSNSCDALKLIELAEAYKKVLMVDHTFIYSGAVEKIKNLVNSGEIGEVYYFDSVRVNLGLFQHDVNVLWDLAPHDFSIMNYIINKDPIFISAVGAKHIKYGNEPFESMVYVTIQLEDNILAHFHLNWLSPVKIRRTLLGGSKKMVVYDHLDTENQVKVYDKGVAVNTSEEKYHALIQYRMGDMSAPKLDQTEALEILCNHFVEAILQNKKPLTDGIEGLKVVKLLEAAQMSICKNGETIYINNHRREF